MKQNIQQNQKSRKTFSKMNQLSSSHKAHALVSDDGDDDENDDSFGEKEDKKKMMADQKS